MSHLFSQKKGLTLIELVVSIFIFALAMSAVAGVFASNARAYKSVRENQRNLEGAQSALNVMAKVLRTSSVSVENVDGSNVIRFYNYAGGAPGDCGEYYFSSTALMIRYKSSGNKTSCFNSNSSSLNSSQTLLSNVSNFYANVTPTTYDTSNISNTKMGKVIMKIKLANSSGQTVELQTTVSLRDYTEAGMN